MQNSEELHKQLASNLFWKFLPYIIATVVVIIFKITIIIWIFTCIFKCIKKCRNSTLVETDENKNSTTKFSNKFKNFKNRFLRQNNAKDEIELEKLDETVTERNDTSKVDENEIRRMTYETKQYLYT